MPVTCNQSDVSFDTAALHFFGNQPIPERFMLFRLSTVNLTVLWLPHHCYTLVRL